MAMLVCWGRRSKLVKALGLFALLTTLTAGRLPLQSARSVLVPMETNSPVGTPFKIKVGESIASSRFMRWNLGRLDRKITVSIDRFVQDVGTDLDLEGFAATGPPRSELGLIATTIIVLRRSRPTTICHTSWSLASSQMWNSMCVSALLTRTPTDCSTMFFLGAKSKELQAAREIEPVPFHTLELTPDAEGKQFHLTLKRIEADRNNLLIYLRPMRDGKETSWGKFSLWDVRTGAESPFKDKLNVAYGTGKPIPLLNVAGYDLAVMSVDPEAGEVTFMLNRISEPMYYQSTQPEFNMIFIYI